MLKPEITTKDGTRLYINKALKAFFKVNEGKEKVIISLPEKQWKMENIVGKLSKKDRVSLFCYERDKEVFLSCCQKGLMKSPLNKNQNKDFVLRYYNTSLPPVQHFDVFNCPVFAWYDYCGVPNAEKLQQVTANLPKNSIIAATFNLSFRQKTTYSSKFQNPENLKKDLLQRFRKVSKCNIFNDCIHFQYYKCKSERMVLLIFSNNMEISEQYRKTELSMQNLPKPKNIDKRFINRLLNKGFSAQYIRKEYNLSYFKYKNILNKKLQKLSKAETNSIRRIFHASDDKEKMREYLIQRFKITSSQFSAIIAWNSPKLKQKML